MNTLWGNPYRWIAGSANSSLTLLLLHGSGGNEDDLVELGRALVPEANILSPRGMVRENGMPRFFRRIADGVFDQEDLAFRTKELAEFVRNAATVHGFSPRNVVAVGFSNGANIAASMLLADTGVLGGAVLLAPTVPFEPDRTPTLSHVPVFVGAGEHDPLVPIAKTRQLVGLLEAGGAQVEAFVHAGGHQITRPEIDAVRSWFEKNFPEN